MIIDDGDEIKGLGFVTMHSSHLERKIDDLLFQLSPIDEFTMKQQKWSISRKIKKAKKVLSIIAGEFAKELIVNLNKCSEHFEWRNELVHGRIYSPDYHKENLESGRPKIPNRQVTSQELYMLANNLVELNSMIYRSMIFDLPKAIFSSASKNV
jgi:hypothetical protein